MGKRVYMAGPLFSQGERTFLEHVVTALSAACGLDPESDFFLPHRDVRKDAHQHDIFEANLRALSSVDVVVAVLDGQDVDSGTCIELGYAHAKGKTLLGLLTDSRAYSDGSPNPNRPNIMVWGVCCTGNAIFQDLDALSQALRQCLDGYQRKPSS